MDIQRIRDSSPTRNKDLHDPETMTASFRLLTNGHGPTQLVVSDIEMLALQSVTYTSLRDLIPSTTSTSSSIMSPIHNSSWHELPIKNPLVKQAALSYLLPMAAPPEAGDKGVFGRLRDTCESCGCFEWLDGVVLWRVKRAFGIHVDDHREQSNNDDKERHEDEEKVEW